MAKCAVCDKGAHFGLKVSHSNRKSNKMWKSNVKSVKVLTTAGPRKMYVCTSFLDQALLQERSQEFDVN